MKRHKIITLALSLTFCAGLLAVPAGANGDMGKAGEYKQISAGDLHAAAIDENGTLWTWGYNLYAQLGNGTTEDSTVPVKVMDNITAVSCGGRHTAAIDSNGSLLMWGYNGEGQLGNGREGNDTDEYSKPLQNIPAKVMDNVVAVSCGWNHTAAIQADGSLWMWGDNGGGQIGNGGEGDNEYFNKTNERIEPCQTVPVKVLDNVVAVSCGYKYTAAIQADGTLWTWGYNAYGVLGNGTDDTSSTPVKVMDNVVTISCGNYHAAAIQADGTLWTWGLCSHLGTGSSSGDNESTYGQSIQTTPVKLMDNVTAVSCGDTHTAVIRTGGSMWVWGNNYCGQLGNDTGEESDVPVKVLDNVSAVSCGERYTVATQADGTLWTWGWNEYGQLGYEGGNGAVSDDEPIQTVPQQVEGIAVPKIEIPVAAAEEADDSGEDTAGATNNEGDGDEDSADAPSTEDESEKSPEKTDAAAPAPEEEKKDGGFPVLPVVLGVGGVAAVAVAALLVVKKRS